MAKNSHRGIVKSPLLFGKIEFDGNIQSAKNTTNAAASKVTVSKIGLFSFDTLISNTLLTKENNTIYY